MESKVKGLFFVGAHAVLPVRPREPDNPSDKQHSDDGIHLVKVFADGAPIRAKFEAAKFLRLQ